VFVKGVVQMDANSLAALHIKEIVASKGITGRHIKQKASARRRLVSRIINGRRTVKLQDLVDLAELLSVDIAVFFMPIMSTKK